MSADSEREIRDRLGGALDTIEPPLPPIGAVMRKGRNIRAQRRAGAAAGLAVIVVLGATLPGLIRHTAPPPKVVYQVTQNPPAVTAKKLTFSGTINRKPWRISLSYSGRDLMEFTGPDGMTGNGPSATPDGEPAALGGSGDTSVTSLVGPVRSDVVRLVLRQPGGASLQLDPVRWRGHRWVAIAVPTKMQLGKLIAYSARGEIAHAIPFGHNTYNAWLRPGQRGLPRQEVRIGSGNMDGQHWSVTGDAGPWGLCFRESGGGGCPLATRLPKGTLATGLFGDCGAPQVVTGQANAAVSYLQIRLSDGSVQRVPTALLDGRRFFAFAMASRVRVDSWTAYGASGQQLGSGGKGLNIC